MVSFKQSTSTKNPLVLFAILSLLAVATQGVDTWSHFTYNLTSLQALESKFSETGLSIAVKPGSLEYLYIKYLAPWLLKVWVAIIMAVIVRFIAYCLVYQICLKCIKEKRSAVVVTFLFMMPVAFSAHGIAPNGLHGPPALFPATLSALFTLTGLLFFLYTGDYSDGVMPAEKKRIGAFSWALSHEGIRYVLAGVAFALSIQFHGLYGITAFAWFFIGTLMALASRGWREWTWFSVELLIVAGSVVYVAYLTFESNSFIPINVTIGEWHRFINALDAEDVALLASLEYGGYGFLPLIFSGTYFAFKTKEKTDIEYLELGVFYTLLIFIVIEIFHYNGMFFGKLSEYFIGAQLRRGVWVAALISLVVLVKNYTAVQNSINEKHKMLLVTLGIVTCVAPSVVTVMLFFAIAVYTHPRSQFLYFLLAFAVGMSLIYVYSGNLNVVIEFKSFILLIVSVFTLFLLKRTNRESIRSVVLYVSVVIILAFFFAGLSKGKFLKSFNMLVSIEKNGSSKIIENHDPKAISCIKKNAVDNFANHLAQKIQFPPIIEFSTYSESLYGQQVAFSFSASRESLFSKHRYEKMLGQISLLVGQSAYNRIFELKEKFSKSIFYNRFIKEYKAITINQLKSTRDKTGLRFYVVENKRGELGHALLCVGDLYHVYDLTKL